jgi:hypothetical protein
MSEKTYPIQFNLHVTQEQLKLFLLLQHDLELVKAFLKSLINDMHLRQDDNYSGTIEELNQLAEEDLEETNVLAFKPEATESQFDLPDDLKELA